MSTMIEKSKVQKLKKTGPADYPFRIKLTKLSIS